MQSTGHDADLAALQASARLPGHVLDVVVLTADATLLASLRQACGPQHALWHAVSANDAVDLLVGGRCGILVADLGALRADAVPLLGRLHAQFPELILMATGSGEEEVAVATLVGSGAIHRFLRKPVSAARASQFIAAATRHYAQLRNVPAIALTTDPTINAGRSPRRFLVGVAAVLAVAITLAVWHLRDEPLSAGLERAQTGAPASQQEIADHLDRAQNAYAAGRLSAPPGDNALEHFRAVLAVQPDHARARQGVDLVVAALEARLTQALQSRNAAQGAVAFTALQSADPQHPRLEEFRAQLLSISRSAGRHPPAKPVPAGESG